MASYCATALRVPNCGSYSSIAEARSLFFGPLYLELGILPALVNVCVKMLANAMRDTCEQKSHATPAMETHTGSVRSCGSASYLPTLEIPSYSSRLRRIASYTWDSCSNAWTSSSLTLLTMPWEVDSTSPIWTSSSSIRRSVRSRARAGV